MPNLNKPHSVNTPHSVDNLYDPSGLYIKKKFLMAFLIWILVILIAGISVMDTPDERGTSLCEVLGNQAKVAWQWDNSRCYLINPATGKWEDSTMYLPAIR